MSRASRRYTHAAVSVTRRNLTGTNRARAVVVSEANAAGVALEWNTRAGTERVALAVVDLETGARYTVRVSLEEWDRVAEAVAGMREHDARERARGGRS